MTHSIERVFRAAALMLLLAGAPAQAADPQDNELSVDASRIQQYLVGEFPRDYQALGGLFTLTARDPELTIPATGQRLQLAFSASAASAGGDDTPVGRIHMSSGLRYDPHDSALYLDQPTLDDVRPASPGQRVDEQTRVLLNLWLTDYARKEPLYKLDPALVATLGDVKVESTRIENGHIVVRFNQPITLPGLGDAQD
jgi:hypothetical protein